MNKKKAVQAQHSVEQRGRRTLNGHVSVIPTKLIVAHRGELNGHDRKRWLIIQAHIEWSCKCDSYKTYCRPSR